MPRIAFIGAGSTVFTRNLVNDIISTPLLADDTTFALMDIDGQRLETSVALSRHLVEARRVDAKVEAFEDRRAALEGADYVITCFQIGGYRPATVVDFEVPRRYGLRQTIGDTLGIGGIMRGLRTIPELLAVCSDMEDVCPEALLLQYANPMAMLCWAVAEASSIETVGLCHSVQGTVAELAADLGLPTEELDFRSAGINHMAFLLELEHRGKDLYPDLRRVADEGGGAPNGNRPNDNSARYEVMRHFGRFVTESSEHFAEYVPWFIKDGRPDLVERFNIPLDEYLHRCEAQIEEWDMVRARVANGEDLNVDPSVEYGAHIIAAREGTEPFTFYGNVPNSYDGGLLIDNLPSDCCVEVRCLATTRGIEPTPVGPLPRQLAALINTNVNVQGLVVEASLSGRRDLVHQAAMLDPHTAAELSLEEIASLVDELIDAHGDLIPPLAGTGKPASPSSPAKDQFG